MQTWKPDLDTLAGRPKYLAIANAILRDIDSGVLKKGARLPPQRSLAEALGVDLTTVTRAYGEAQRQGLITGDGRRGSFVRPKHTDMAKVGHNEPADTGMNAPPEIPGGSLVEEFRRSVEALLTSNSAQTPFQYQPSGGMVAARVAGANLMNHRGIPCQDDTVIVTAGGQHALHAIVSAELSSGDVVAVAGNVYPGFLALARRYGLQLCVVPSDRNGLEPDGLNAVCSRSKVRAVYVVPTNDNPTTVTMNTERRAALASVAQQHGLIVIEDDAYGLLPEYPLPPIASFAPDLTWHIASVSKVLSPGLRVAWMRAPTVAHAWRLGADVHETAIMAPPLNAAVVADWAESGVFQRLAAAVRVEAQFRQALAVKLLGSENFWAQPEGYHLWLPLQQDANVGEIVGVLRQHNLSVVGGGSFAVDKATVEPALRISIGGSISHDRLERGLRLLRALTGPDATRKVSLV